MGDEGDELDFVVEDEPKKEKKNEALEDIPELDYGGIAYDDKSKADEEKEAQEKEDKEMRERIAADDKRLAKEAKRTEKAEEKKTARDIYKETEEAIRQPKEAYKKVTGFLAERAKRKHEQKIHKLKELELESSIARREAEIKGKYAGIRRADVAASSRERRLMGKLERGSTPAILDMSSKESDLLQPVKGRVSMPMAYTEPSYKNPLLSQQFQQKPLSPLLQPTQHQPTNLMSSPPTTRDVVSELSRQAPRSTLEEMGSRGGGAWGSLSESKDSSGWGNFTAKKKGKGKSGWDTFSR